MKTSPPHEAFQKFEKMSPFEIKDALARLARQTSEASNYVMLNAGRGNPNWVATTPREGFFALGQFAITECKRVMNETDYGGMPAKDGIAPRLDAWLSANASVPGVHFLRAMIPFAVSRFGFDADAFVHELVDSVVGDNYPVPDRMLVHIEKIVHDYLMWAMCGDEPPPGRFDLFAVEGGTAAMCYIFKSMMTNGLLKRGDTIALGTPIFTPYLEIPELDDYALKVVHVRALQEILFQFSDEELAKLEDPAVKAFFVVNPGNPTSAAISPEVLEKIKRLVENKRPDLIILTDDVYGTFVNGFRSLMAVLPRNTIGVYSYSKYFGCTGWRLGIIALHEDNIMDEAIAKLPEEKRAALNHRYGSLTLTPEKMKLIDRMVADSRDVALNHTAGLSLPQQVQMAMFSLFQRMDSEEKYRLATNGIVRRRVRATVEGLGIDVKAGTSPLFAAYYGLIDLEFWIKKYLGEEVAAFVSERVHPLDIVYRLAKYHGIVLLNGGGFDAPDWSVRISFANLPEDVYRQIGAAVRDVTREYVDVYRQTYPGRIPAAPEPAPS